MNLLLPVYALVSYTIFFVTFLYSIAFVGGFGVPKTIDSPLLETTGAGAWMVNILLLSAFALQHSIMARPAFKRAWTKVIPPAAERATYVLISSLLLAAIYAFWQPLPTVIWDVSGTVAEPLLWALFGLGWVIVLLSTFMISHFELFGLAQIWRRVRNQPSPPLSLQVRMLYRIVRHPLMLGFLIAFWSTPTMTEGHLLFAIMTTGYIVVGTMLEERDLVAVFGETYRRYRERVPMLVPFLKTPVPASHEVVGDPRSDEAVIASEASR